ncbi:MAG: type II secretion system protein [Candidatus Omnitrophica bacterium]|nr:type II secretion system protein [Candidatus Omnitrophota bacterium]
MLKLLKQKKGFTLSEVVFAALISIMVIAAVLSIWVFTYRTWAGERVRTGLRTDLVKALETIKNDLRLSSLTHISFYPSGGEPYTAISMPVADLDGNGFFTLNANGKIDWDKTVIYHLFPAEGTQYTLRRTVFNSRDNSKTDVQRYVQMAAVVSSGSGGSYTDTEFLKNVDVFEISSLAPVIDFYDVSATAVKANQVVFGWARLSPGDHTIRLEVTGKNAASSGYDLGVDNIRIEPSGSVREMEYYDSLFAPAGAFTANGGTAGRIYDSMWNNNNYLELASGGVGSYMEIVDYYDLWRESAFNSASLNNTERTGEEARVGLDVPEGEESGEITWFADTATGDAAQAGHDGYVNPVDPLSAPPAAVVVRTVIDHSCIDIDPDEPDDQVDIIRASFKSASSGTLRIEKAYITRKSNDAAAEVYDGLENDSPAAKTIQECHRHQQLFFKDPGTGNIVPDIVISSAQPQNGEAWSEWTAFPLVVRDGAGQDTDYFISFYISDVSQAECSYWQSADTQAYYLTGAGIENAAGTPVWGGTYAPDVSTDVFVTASIDTGKKTGQVESQVFDTSLDSPAYKQLGWSENRPVGTNIEAKARSSGSLYMTGATDWDAVSGNASNPHALSIGSGRYVQFFMDLATEPFWESAGSTLSYADYITAQIGLAFPYDFPETGSLPYITKTSSPWVDDVAIDWPGEDRICTITADIAKKNDYGQAKITIDGTELIKVLSVHVSVSEEVKEVVVSEENYVEIEPRNTGK